MIPSRAGLVLAAVALLLLPLTAAGQQAASQGQQEVRGAVTEGGTLAPIEGAMVLLLDESGRRVGGVLSGVNGRFRLPAPTPGRYQLRVDRIGYGTTNTEVFVVVAGRSVERSVVSTVRPIQLAGIDVKGSSRSCDLRPAEGLATATLWGEARKALEAATWTSERAIYSFTWSTYERLLDERARVVLSEKRSTRRAYSTSPFVAASPDTLTIKGFVQVLPNREVQYWAPDAPVLLSDAFLDTHCFRVEGRENEGVVEIGLTFEPVSGRRIPDVQGVLWIDQETARLRSLEYTYTNLPQIDYSDAGGTLTFVALPNGTWVVQDWKILMPLATQVRNSLRTASTTYAITGYRAEGGVVQRAVTNGGEVVLDNVGAGIRGVVVDSLGEPAAGTRVRIKGTAEATVTDASGTFNFAGIGEGTWIVVPAPDLLEAAGVEAPGVEVAVGRTGMATVRVPLPSLTTAIREACGATPPDRFQSVIAGRVLDETGNPVSGAEIRLDWQEVKEGLDTFLGTPHWATQFSNAAGAFRFCAVPTGESAVAQAHLDGRHSQQATVEVEDPAEVIVLTLRDEAAAVATAARESGPASLRVRVTDAATGKAVAGAQVGFPELKLFKLSDRNGSAVFKLESGEHRLEATMLGYSVASGTVALSPGEAALVEVQLTDTPIDLPGITVTVESTKLSDVGFYDRREQGFGFHADRPEIERTNPRSAADVLRRLVPAIKFFSNGGNEYAYFDAARVGGVGVGAGRAPGGSSTPRGACFPAVFLDGALVAQGGKDPKFDVALLLASDIEGVEVYAGTASIPASMSGTGSGCGVIAVWTRR